MDRLHGILVFIRVVEQGTLSGAARSLGVTTAAVSSTINRLEQQLSTRLLIRTTRKINTTPEGAEFYARCKRIIADLAEAEMAASRASHAVTGRLRARLPLILGHMWIVPQLPRFMRAHPGLAVEVVCMDFVPYTIDDGLDLSVQTGDLRNSSLAVRPLAETRYVACAAPAYFAEHGKPQTLKDLNTHTCVGYRRPRNGRVREWRFETGAGIRHYAANSPLIFNRIELVVEAAKAGCGLIQVPECYVQPYLARGELVEVLEDYKTGGYHISVVYRQQQRLAPKLRVFMDFLVDLFEPPPWTRPLSGSPKATAPGPGARARQR
jgi:LysR family transcriptional regulator for bpeEF and oprC